MELTTTPEIIKELGGIHAVALLTGRKYDAVWVWKNKGTFPSDTYLLLTGILKDMGYTAPPSLWRMAETV